MRHHESTPAAREPLAVVYRPTDELRPFARNARTHPPDQIAQIRASIREFGFTNPILLKDDGQTIGAGHGRWEAARLEGLAEVPTITLTGLTDTQWRAYVLADNQIPLGAAWDTDILGEEISALLADDFDIESIGFDPEDFPDPADFEAISEDEVRALDRRAAVKCPSCGHEFEPK